MNAGPAHTLILVSKRAPWLQTSHKPPSRLGHTVLRTLAHCGPLAWQSNKTVLFCFPQTLSLRFSLVLVYRGPFSVSGPKSPSIYMASFCLGLVRTLILLCPSLNPIPQLFPCQRSWLPETWLHHQLLPRTIPLFLIYSTSHVINVPGNNAICT